jgi:hypothetical protein
LAGQRHEYWHGPSHCSISHFSRNSTGPDVTVLSISDRRKSQAAAGGKAYPEPVVKVSDLRRAIWRFCEAVFRA